MFDAAQTPPAQELIIEGLERHASCERYEP